MSDKTLKQLLDEPDMNRLPYLLKKLALGTMLEVQEYDTGTITASASVTIPGGALNVQSARVVTSGTAASVGVYLAADSGVTPLLPPGGANTAVGIAKLSADGSTITFPNTVTRAIIRYTKKPATDLATVAGP